jgi:hypothetical protein
MRLCSFSDLSDRPGAEKMIYWPPPEDASPAVQATDLIYVFTTGGNTRGVARAAGAADTDEVRIRWCPERRSNAWPRRREAFEHGWLNWS